MVAKIQGAQRDFSYGEVDVGVKRSDELPQRKAGLRQCSNMRILNSKSVQNRPGRSALFPAPTSRRIEEVTMSPGHVFSLAFGAGELRIRNSAGALLFTFTTQGNGAVLPWSSATVNQIVITQLGLSVYITFAGMRPQVLTWDGSATWSIADYFEQVTAGGQKRTPFYRISPQDITLQPSATKGAITVTFSSPIAVAGMANTRVRYCGRQILLTSLVSSTVMNAVVTEPLPPAQTLTVTSSSGFNLGDVVTGTTSGAKGQVTSAGSVQSIVTTDGISPFNVGDAVVGGTSGATGVVTAIVFENAVNFTVSLDTATSFTAGETITGPGGARTIFSVSSTGLTVQLLGTGPSFGTEGLVGPSASTIITAVAAAAPQAVTVWDDEVFNAYRGYPAACFADQFRLGFCDFPSVPGGIAWSAINSPTDLYVVGATLPNGAMFEIAPDKVQVKYVIPGPESSEFVFCDSKVYYIKIDAQNPLKPGSVSFQILSGDGAASVHPRVAQDVIFYVNAGGNSVMAVVAPGAYYRPFNTDNLTEFHNHLFNNIVTLAAPNADATFNERYVYAMNADGSIACGKYDINDGKISAVGWVPWSGSGIVSWVSAQNARVLFTSNYFGSFICEMLDDSRYLDAAVTVNSLPAPFVSAGKGPLWWIPEQTVFLMDQVTRAMGVYQVDVNGNIIPQGNAGEDLTAATLVAGQSWTSIVEPFCPDANPGQDVGQRMFPRRVARFAAYVVHSTGFVMGRLFSGRITPTSPALGTLMNSRRFPAWNQDDDPTKPPPSRETTERIRPIGRSFDPRVALIKDTPGPLQVLELGIEATV